MTYFQKGLLRAAIFCFLSITSTYAQTGPRWYFNINEANVALDGYDLVAYQKGNEAKKGSADFQSSYKGISYQFASASNKKDFEKDPERYLPAFGGWCTFFMGIDQAGSGFPPTRMIPDPESFLVVDKTLYLFRKTPRQDFKTVFESGDQKAILKRANEFWESRQAYGDKTEALPEGLNPMARMENLDWEPFMGKWEAQVYWWADTTGTAKSRFNGEWEFNYGYYGFCIMDDFRGVPDQPFAGTQNGPAVRGYDVQNKQWHMTYIPVNQPRAATWLMTGEFKGHGHLEGTLETQDPYGNDILQKVVFKLVNKDHFQWRAHWSWDGGKTWKEDAGFAECKRIE